MREVGATCEEQPAARLSAILAVQDLRIAVAPVACTLDSGFRHIRPGLRARNSREEGQPVGDALAAGRGDVPDTRVTTKIPRDV